MTIFRRVMSYGLALFAVLALPAAAADDWDNWTPYDISNSYGIWGDAHVVGETDPNVPGGNYRRVAISPQPAHSWDVGTYIMIAKPVKKGDALAIAVWARAASPPAGNDFVELIGRIYETAHTSVGVTPESRFLVGKVWKCYYAGGIAKSDYPVGALKADVLLGTGEQAVDIGPAVVLDLGPNYDMSKLPRK
jgi:hypothetical protein